MDSTLFREFTSVHSDDAQRPLKRGVRKFPVGHGQTVLTFVPKNPTHRVRQVFGKIVRAPNYLIPADAEQFVEKDLVGRFRVPTLSLEILSVVFRIPAY